MCCQDEWYKENGSEGSLGSVPKEGEGDGGWGYRTVDSLTGPQSLS